MAIGDLDSGARFGLPPIGLPQAGLDTPGSDTERRAFPGLATKSSVFAWVAAAPNLMVRNAMTGTIVETINLRNNTATGGSSVDVPTWAAGVVIAFQSQPTAMGTSTYHYWQVFSGVAGAANLLAHEDRAIPVHGAEIEQVTVPFFDEPFFTVQYTTDGTGTASIVVKIIGFVRNV